MIKYNEEVKSILKRSELEALKNKDEYVDSSHLLLSLTSTKNTLSDLLINNNITYETIKKEIKEGTSNKETILYSKEILNILESIIIDEDIIIEKIRSGEIEPNYYDINEYVDLRSRGRHRWNILMIFLNI